MQPLSLCNFPKTIFQSPYLKVIFINFAKINNKSTQFIASSKRLFFDTVGAFFLRRWNQTEKENIVSVKDSMLPELLRIQKEAFENGSKEKLIRYSKNARDIFYVIKDQEKIAGFCIYYLRPSLSLNGFKKKSIISSIAIDKDFRGRGLAERILIESIKEMKLNGISSIGLYVNINNQPAIRLYEKMGFEVTQQIKNICGQGQSCYEMELKIV